MCTMEHRSNETTPMLIIYLYVVYCTVTSMFIYFKYICILEVVYLHWLLFCPKLRSWKVRTHLKWEFIDVEMSRDSTVTENPKFNVDNNKKKPFLCTKCTQNILT